MAFPEFVIDTLLQGSSVLTVTLKQQDFVFPHPSVALYHTCVLPTGKAAPLASPLVCVVVPVPEAQVEVPVGAV